MLLPFLLRYSFAFAQLATFAKGTSNLVDVHISVHDSIDGERRDAPHAKLLHDIFPVGNDRGKTDVEAVGYLLVNQTLHNQSEHLYLTVG